MSALAVYVAVVQFLFGTTWTLYVIYLPQLVQGAGIGREWVPWILVADQLVFAAMDVATGFWVDRVRAAFGRFGGLMLAGTVLSGVAFLALPYAGASGSVLLIAIAIWAVTSSALRSPPWALLSRYAATPRVPWLSAIVLTGTAIAGAIAPYLGVALRAVDPRVPFVLSTLTLVAAVVGLLLAEKRLPPNPPAEPKPSVPPIGSPQLFTALLLLALGFQVHFSLSLAPRYLQLAPREQLPYLMPVFWIGFNLLMFPASRAVQRMGPAAGMALGAAFGALAMLVGLASNLSVLLVAEFLAGGCWGAATVGAYSAAVALGRTGREGRFLGTLFAVLALAVAARIALVGSGLAQGQVFSALQPWLPQTLWLCAALVLIIQYKQQDTR